ncbi:ROK family transcriptional regulator [Deinococcus maricopensis]|uniref:Glucokinase n=1 Tax=Deinococcus maricopensis (strain DSM 21211 / LMG 22137 / NRRL B-23946 / LB-34) TaxID=709986 RepID=E8UAK7_DEIML|nr:ROK family transcriptional regulator [Deinococcus maricopensis]ADV68096.1 Glucokinase [Deinococcus maricopensis DSM 21211]
MPHHARTDVLDPAAVRARHTLLILDQLWHEDLARVDLAARVGLSRSAISSIINELHAAHLVLEVGRRERHHAGRRATVLTLNAQAAFLIAVDLGATHVRAALLDLRCRVLSTREVPHDIQTGPERTYAAIHELIAAVLADASVSVERVAMIGVGIPGPVDHHTGRVVSPPNMRGWDDENVAGNLERTYPAPVYVDNDANLGALAEHRFGQRAGTADLVYVKAATGIGAGVILGGRLHRGARGGAGEVGHISINEHGPAGRSGNPGSLESYASAPVILDIFRAYARAGATTSLPADTDLTGLMRAADRDPLARRVWQETGQHLGIAVTTMLNLFNPGAVVLGGTLSRAGEPLLHAVRAVVQHRAMSINRDRVHIDLGTLGAMTTVLGAGVMLLDHLFTPTGLRHLYAVANGSAYAPAPPRAPPLLVAHTGTDRTALQTRPTLIPGGTT